MSKKQKTLYKKTEWFDFRKKVFQHKGKHCEHCGRSESVCIQVHHEHYFPNRNPWDYHIDEMTVLCSGCHAREHDILISDRGWILIAMYDLGGLTGTCTRHKGEDGICGQSIRYAHAVWHPLHGKNIVGSQCVEFLTLEDQRTSKEYLKVYKKMGDFVQNAPWVEGHTRNNTPYKEFAYKHNRVRVYFSNYETYGYNVGIKELGVRWYDWTKPEFNILTERKATELAYLSCLSGEELKSNGRSDDYELYNKVFEKVKSENNLRK